MDSLSYKDFQKVNNAVTKYVFSEKEPRIRGCRKDAFEKLRPMLNRWRDEFQTLKKKRRITPMDKNSILLYLSDYEPVKDFSLEEKGMLFDAIFEYASTGSTNDLPPVVLLAFKFFRMHIDENNKKWNEIKTKRIEAGSKGGKQKAASAKQNLANLANAKDAKQSQANLAVNVNDNVNVNDTLSLTLSHLVESASESVSEREEANKVFNPQSIKEQLLSDEIWKESVCMQSTLGVSFISMLPGQLDKFIAYIVSIGEERSISNISDAKRRFTYWWQNHGRKEVQDENKQVYTVPN